MVLLSYLILFTWTAAAASLPLLENVHKEKLKNWIIQDPVAAFTSITLAGTFFGAGSALFWQGVFETMQARRAAQKKKTPAQCGRQDDIFPPTLDPDLAPYDPTMWGGKDFADILRGSAKRDSLTP